jgi:predicted aspartyl protease
MKYLYNKSYQPAAPVIVIYLAYPEANWQVGPISGLVDTGADGTLVPQTILDQIGAPLIDQVRLRSHWGEWHQAHIYVVDFGISQIRLPSIEVVGDGGNEIVLGRNVINSLRLKLDGPRQQVEILK